jgi:hypothetical protein
MTNKEIQAAYKDRLRKAGYKRIDVWVKPEYLSQIRMIEKWLKENG